MSEEALASKEFRGYFDSYAEAIRNFIYFKCGNQAQAEDIMQEAFLRLWPDREKVQPEKVKSFLFTVANNLFLDGVRHEQVKFRYQQQQVERSDNESPQHILEQAEFKQALEDAINALPPGQREVFLMNRIEKLTYQEIADRLEVSVKAVEKRMGKALKKMRKLTKKI